MHILIIGGQSNLQKVLRDNGITVHLVTSESELKYGKIHINNSDKYYITDFENYLSDQFLEFIINLDKKYNFKEILSYTDRGIESANYLAYKLNKNRSSFNAIKYTQNKYLMRKFLNSYHYYSHPFNFIQNSIDICEFLKKHEYGVIKPIRGTGSKNVKYIEYQNLDDVDINSYLGEQFIIEKYITGSEHSVETISLEGKHYLLGIVNKHNTGKPNFVGTLHSLPSKLRNSTQDKIKNIIFELLDLFEYQTGPAHIEIKLNNEKVHIIEIQFRVGGNFNKLLEHATGHNIYELLINNILYKHYPSDFSSNSCAISYFRVPQGTLKDVKINPDFYNQYLIDYKLKYKVGSNYRNEWVDTGDRAGYVICSGDTVSNSEINVKKALDDVNFIMEGNHE